MNNLLLNLDRWALVILLLSTILYVTVSSVDGDYPEFITTPFRTKLLGTGFGKTPIITGAHLSKHNLIIQ
jgi:hypothetical protein